MILKNIITGLLTFHRIKTRCRRRQIDHRILKLVRAESLSYIAKRGVRNASIHINRDSNNGGLLVADNEFKYEERPIR